MRTLLTILLACTTRESYIVEGTVVEVHGTDEVVLDHEHVDGLEMPPMIMPFRVRDPSLLRGLEPGHKVLARLEIFEEGGQLTKIRITGKGPPPAPPERGPAPLRVGESLPRTTVVLEDGSTTILGQGQERPTLLTFLYTRCPLPEYCPATVARFQAIQARATPSVRLLAITLDPENDTPAVLQRFAAESGADPSIWRFGRVEDLPALALYAGLTVTRDGDAIAHGLRVLALDDDGVLKKRFDDLDFPVEAALDALR